MWLCNGTVCRCDVKIKGGNCGDGCSCDSRRSVVVVVEESWCGCAVERCVEVM